MKRLILDGCIAAFLAVVYIALYRAWHLERAMRRPTGAELAAMTDAEFARFVQRSGIKTVSEPWVEPYDGEAIGV